MGDGYAYTQGRMHTHTHACTHISTSIFIVVVVRKGWFSRASGRNVGEVFNPVVKLVLENQPFLMPEPAEKPSL